MKMKQQIIKEIMIITCKCGNKAEIHGYCLTCWYREEKEKVITALKLVCAKVKCKTPWYKKIWGCHGK
jgi:hypothetical protein